MGFWDYVRIVVDKFAPPPAPPTPPQVSLAAHDVHLAISTGMLSERLAARLARLEAALAAGDKRVCVVEEIAQIKKGGA